MSESSPPGRSRVAADVGPALAVLAVLVAGWQAAVVVSGVPPVVLPSPADVARALVASAPTFLRAAAITALTAAGGLAAGTVAGLALASAMVRSRAAAAAIHPYLVALRIAPLVAIAPLLFLWIGDGLLSRALLVTTMTTFPVAVASLDGLRSTPEAYLNLARSVAAPDRQVFLRVRMPAAAPSVFAGVKLAAALSVVGAIVAEFLTLRAGIGYRLFDASTRLRTPTMFAALVVIAWLGLAFYFVPALVEDALYWEP